MHNHNESMKSCKSFCFVFIMLVVLCVSLSVANADVLKLPTGVKSIEADAFFGADNIDEVLLPDGIESIGYHAFSATGLRKINLPASLNSISDYALDHVRGVEVVVEPGTYAYNWAANNGFINPQVSITGISLEAADYVYVHDQLLIHAVINPEDATDRQLHWVSDNETVATVNDKGVVTAVSAGSVTVRAISTEDPSVYAEMQIQVRARDDSLHSPYTDFNFVVNSDGTCTVQRYLGTDALVVVPATDGNDHPVTMIGQYCFERKTCIEEVVLPDSVVSIDNLAFADCTSLKRIAFPSNVAFLGHGAFRGTAIESICIPEGITEINALCYGCSQLKEAYLPDSLTTVGEYSFSSTAISSIDLPETVTTIGQNAFSACKNLEEIILPSSVVSVGNSAFLSSGIRRADIRCGITEIPKNLFGSCSNLEQVSMSNYIVSIGYGAFENCRNLIHADIPDSVTVIENYAFSNCVQLVLSALPSRVESIGNHAFSCCVSLNKELYIPASVKTIGTKAFYEAANDLRLILPDSFDSSDQIPYYSGMYITLVCDVDSLTAHTIVSMNAEFYDAAHKTKFRGVDQKLYYRRADEDITEIYYPEWMSGISGNAFTGCYNLKEIVIPERFNISEIGAYTFSRCPVLERVYLPDSVTKIGEGAFSNSPMLEYIYLGSHVETVGQRALGRNGTKPYFIYCAYQSPTAHAISGHSDFIDPNYRSLKMRYIANSSSVEELHVTKCVGSDAVIDVPYGVKIIDQDVFYENENLRSVTFPASLESIETGAFMRCTSLTAVWMNEGLKSIGEYAFDGCSSLKTASLPNSLQSLGVCSFSGCSQLNNIDIPYGISHIPDSCFSGCQSLSRLSVPETVTYIGAGALANCAFTSINIPDGLLTIGEKAFGGCRSLRKFDASHTFLRKIGAKAFYNCESLTYVALPNYSNGSVPNIGKDAFTGCVSLQTVALPDCWTLGKAPGYNELNHDGKFDRLSEDVDGFLLILDSDARQYYAEYYHYNYTVTYIPVHEPLSEDVLDEMRQDMTQIETAVNLLLMCHDLYTVGYDLGGIHYQVDFSELSEYAFLEAYTLLFGDSLNAADIVWLRRFAIAEQIMNSLAPQVDWIPEEALEEVFSQFVSREAFLKPFTYLQTSLSDGILSEERCKQLAASDDWKTLEIVGNIKDAAKIGEMVFQLLLKEYRYCQVDKSAVEDIIESYRKTGNEDLAAVADILLEMITPYDREVYLLKSLGFSLGNFAIDMMRDQVFENLAKLGPGGMMAAGAFQGSLAANNVLFNLNETANAIYKAQWCIDQTEAYRNSFVHAFEAFKGNPGKYYKAFATSSYAFVRLLVAENQAVEEFVLANDSALVSQVQAFFSFRNSAEVNARLFAEKEELIKWKLVEPLETYYYDIMKDNISHYDFPFTGDDLEHYNELLQGIVH